MREVGAVLPNMHEIAGSSIVFLPDPSKTRCLAYSFTVI